MISPHPMNPFPSRPDPTRRPDPDRAAFTLVELLVVLALIGLLASLLLPALGKARARARNIACVSNLRQLGLAVRSYAEDHDGRLPAAELLPTLPADPAAPLPRLADLLAAEVGTAPSPVTGTSNSLPLPTSRVFLCPEDRASRWRREGSSYEWNTDLNHRRIDETRNAQVHVVGLIRHDDGDVFRAETNKTLAFPPTTTPLLYDYENFHPRPPRSGKNAVFMDGHVDPLDTMLR